MGSEPPSVVPPPAMPPEPGSAAYRSSSAPTTSVAPPALKPGLTWPVLRLALAACLMVLAAEGGAVLDPNARGFAQNALSTLGITLLVAGLPMLVPRYRSLRAFSWLLLIAAFVQLYACKDGLLGVSVSAMALRAGSDVAQNIEC